MLWTALLILGMWSSVLLFFRQPLLARWREPTFIQPIVILESDDWGAGPAEQAPMLDSISALLERQVNGKGEHPVMTLGLILAVPAEKPDCTKATWSETALVSLTHESQSAVLASLREGRRRGTFSLQLHGLTHFNQDAFNFHLRNKAPLMSSLCLQENFWTEMLPSEVQSAWTNAANLPSTRLMSAVVRDIAQREGALWHEQFGDAPRVAVPTTFLWNDDVEWHWAEIGIRVLVTPGARYQLRNSEGKPDGIDKRILNGECGAQGLRYVVRDVYFEPAIGHTAAFLLEQVSAHVEVYRPALVEMHRFNFCGPRACSDVLTILDDALRDLLRTHPDVRFMSTQQLGQVIDSGDPTWISDAPHIRMRALLARARQIPRFCKVARITGLCFPLRLCQKVVT